MCPPRYETAPTVPGHGAVTALTPYLWRRGRARLAPILVAVLFDVRTHERQGWSVVSVLGEVDLATIPSLRQHLDAVTGARVAFDLSGVDHFDPLGFGVVIAGSLKTHRRGALFAVICPEGRPRELFAESGLDQVLTLVDSLDDLQD